MLLRKHKAQAGMGGGGQAFNPSYSSASSKQTWAFAKEFRGWAGLPGISRAAREQGVELAYKGL